MPALAGRKSPLSPQQTDCYPAFQRMTPPYVARRRRPVDDRCPRGQARLHRHRPVVASKGFTLEQPKRIKSV